MIPGLAFYSLAFHRMGVARSSAIMTLGGFQLSFCLGLGWLVVVGVVTAGVVPVAFGFDTVVFPGGFACYYILSSCIGYVVYG